MRKLAFSLIAATMLISTAQAQGYRTATQDAQRQAWQNAAMGTAFSVGGMVLGNVIGRMSQPQSGSYAPQGYAPQGYAPAPGYVGAPPPVVNPYYYPQAQACVTQRAPVYNAYGQVTEFVQYCANTPR